MLQQYVCISALQNPEKLINDKSILFYALRHQASEDIVSFILDLNVTIRRLPTLNAISDMGRSGYSVDIINRIKESSQKFPSDYETPFLRNVPLSWYEVPANRSFFDHHLKSEMVKIGKATTIRDKDEAANDLIFLIQGLDLSLFAVVMDQLLADFRQNYTQDDLNTFLHKFFYDGTYRATSPLGVSFEKYKYMNDLGYEMKASSYFSKRRLNSS